MGKDKVTYSAPIEVKDPVIYKGVTDMKDAGGKRSVYARPGVDSKLHADFSHGAPGSKITDDIPAQHPDTLALIRCHTSDDTARLAATQVGAKKVVHANREVFNTSTPLEYEVKKGSFHAIDMCKPGIKKSNDSLRSNGSASSGHSQDLPGARITEKGKKLKIRKPSVG